MSTTVTHSGDSSPVSFAQRYAERGQADYLDGRADHFIYGDGADPTAGIGFAVRALTQAVLALTADAEEEREFEIRKAALAAAARMLPNDEGFSTDQITDLVVDQAREFEGYLRGDL